MHIAYTITYNVHTASRVSEAQKRGGGAPPLASQNGLAPPPWQTGAPQVIFEKKKSSAPPPGNFLFCAPGGFKCNSLYNLAEI